MNPDDTIIAVSTASGIARRAIVRLSGPDAFRLVQECLAGGPDLSAQPPYSRLVSELRLADDTLLPADLYLMRAPRSYTREDVAEIHTFGSPVLIEMIVEDFLRRGARLAQPGEFTRRAFLNGRLDLSQAEAVLQVIRSRSDAELRLALRHLDGRFSGEIEAARQRLLRVCTLAELSIDFSDQDAEIIATPELLAAINDARAAIRGLAEQARRQSGGRPGVSVAIRGRPNVGKSSLLNALLGRPRSIVTHLPGTTRDAVEETLDIDGLLFRLCDTAGERDTADAVEREAVRRAAAASASADIVLLVIDLSEGLSDQERELWQAAAGKPRIAVLNKADLPAARPPEDIAAELGGPAVRVSSTMKWGIDDLKGEMARMVREGRIDASAPSFLLNARHCDAVRRGAEALDRAAQAAADGLSVEFVALDLRIALDALGEIAGRAPGRAGCTGDILDRIFSEFCIGK